MSQSIPAPGNGSFDSGPDQKLSCCLSCAKRQTPSQATLSVDEACSKESLKTAMKKKVNAQ
jgi:hypothetical protein